MSAKLYAHIRSNVVGYVALFFAVTMGTAYATHPGGANTISSGDIQDNQVRSVDVRDDALSSGGLAAVDLRPAAVGTSEVTNNSLTGADIDEPSLTGNAKKLVYSPGAPDSGTEIATVGPYTLKGTCDFIPGIDFLGTRLLVNGPAGTADSMLSETLNDTTDLGNSSERVSIPPFTDKEIVTIVTPTAPTAEQHRKAGTAMIRSGSTLVQVDFNVVADARSGGGCFIYGTGTRAT